MVRTIEIQKIIEKQLIQELLRELGYSVTKFQPTEKPDAIVSVVKAGVKSKLCIEHTSYFNDTVAGKCSPKTVLAEFWEEVQASLKRRICKRPKLGAVQLSLGFRKKAPIPGRLDEQRLLARSLASELVLFMINNPVRIGKFTRYGRHDWNPVSKLGELVDNMHMSRWDCEDAVASNCSWNCMDISGGSIGLSLNNIISSINQKNKKAKNYIWNRNSELWLMIVADGAIVSNHAGRHQQKVAWSDTDLALACKQSPFDRILFWDQRRCWYKWLKPQRQIKQYRDPYLHF